MRQNLGEFKKLKFLLFSTWEFSTYKRKEEKGKRRKQGQEKKSLKKKDNLSDFYNE